MVPMMSGIDRKRRARLFSHLRSMRVAAENYIHFRQSSNLRIDGFTAMREAHYEVVFVPELWGDSRCRHNRILKEVVSNPCPK